MIRGYDDGSPFAIVLGMNNTRATRHRDTVTSFMRVVRGFAEGSLIAFAFAFAILLLGMPVVLIIRSLHDGLSWLVPLSGETSTLVEALVSVSSVAGGLTLAVVLGGLLVRLLRSRRTFRARVISREMPRMHAGRQALGSAA
jgi:hypothetical protein